MSLEKQIEELQRIVQVLQNDKNIQARVTTVGAFATLAEYKTRIFTEGKASSGAKIGSYDTSPFYASSESLRGLPKGKFNKKGKTGKSKCKNISLLQIGTRGSHEKVSPLISRTFNNVIRRLQNSSRYTRWHAYDCYTYSACTPATCAGTWLSSSSP